MGGYEVVIGVLQYIYTRMHTGALGCERPSKKALGVVLGSLDQSITVTGPTIAWACSSYPL